MGWPHSAHGSPWALSHSLTPLRRVPLERRGFAFLPDVSLAPSG